MTGSHCSHCGQKQVQRLALGRIFRDALRHVTTLEGVFPRTFVGLWRDPGRVCREYIEGQRVRYFNPVKYIFLLLTVFVLVVQVLQPDMRGPMPVVRTQTEIEMLYLFISIQAYLSFVFLLPVALVQRLLFRNTPFNVAECYTFNLYVEAQVMVVWSFIAAVDAVSTWPGFAAMLVFQLVYSIWALTGLYQSNRVPVLIKGFILVATNLLAANITAIVVANLIVLIG